MIRTIFFDADGTLYDEAGALNRAECLTALRISEASGIPPAEIYRVFRREKARAEEKLRGSPRANDRVLWFRETLRTLNVSAVTEETAGSWYWLAALERMEPYADLTCVLPQLCRKYRLFVLTDEFRSIQLRKLDRLGLRSFFEQVISADEVGEIKPSEALFRYALNKAGCSAQTAVMIGDNPDADLRGGRQAGLFTAWLQRGKYYYHPIHDANRPDITFRNYILLEDALERVGPVKSRASERL